MSSLVKALLILFTHVLYCTYTSGDSTRRTDGGLPEHDRAQSCADRGHRPAVLLCLLSAWGHPHSGKCTLGATQANLRLPGRGFAGEERSTVKRN